MSLQRSERKRKARKHVHRSFFAARVLAGTLWSERPRELRLEPLEERRLLAVDMVTSGLDDGSGGTLRSVIAAAASRDTIEFASGITQIDLTQGQIAINKNLTIQGPGASSLTIDQTTSGGARIFLIDATDSNSSPVSVSMSGLTLTGGNAGDSGGGAISNNGTLTLSDSTLSNNSAQFGGGLESTGTAAVSGSTLSGNSATNSGGAIEVDGGTATVTDSTFSGNSAAVWGGGINNASGTLTVSNSTFSDNTAQQGGAVANGGTVTVIDSTLSGNTAQEGGGIETSGTATVTDSTLSGNSASSQGGGFWTIGTTKIANTIVADNTLTGTGSDPDVFGGFATTDHNLVGVVGDATGFTDGNGDALNGNQVGTAANPIDPLLAPLGNYTGQTQTMPQLANSPALNAGDPSPASPFVAPATDQRGLPRLTNGQIDIGATQHDDVVTSGADNGGAGTLRTVLAAAAPGDTIEFNSGITQIDLTQGQIEIDRDLTIQGPGAGSLTINQTASNARVFQVDGNQAVSLSGVTLMGGNTPPSNGGGIFNSGNLSLDAVVFSRNSVWEGGGLFNDSGATATITASTFWGNTARDAGGAIYNYFGTTVVVDCTFSSNSAGGGGGGIYNMSGTVTVSSSTFSGNSASTGGGFYSDGSATSNAANSIVAGNTANTSDPDVSGSFAATDHDLIGVVGDATGFTDGSGNAINGNLVGTADAPTNPMLAYFANYGGPTQTMVLASGSPGLNAGDPAPAAPFVLPTTDQRGLPRLANGQIDIGATQQQVGGQHVDFVTDAGDDSAGATLRNIIAEAAHGDIVEFALPRGTSQIDLTQGQIEINKDLSIVGPSAGPLTIEQTTSGGARIFQIDATDPNSNAITVLMSGLTLTGGTASGNDPGDFGGGIYNLGTLSLETMALSANSAAMGGGIYNTGTLTVATSLFLNNSAAYDGGGIQNAGGTITLNDSTLSDNSVTRWGGAINNSSGTLTVADSTFSDNSTQFQGGGIANGGTLTVSDSTFAGNAAQTGGGLESSGTLTVTDSTLSGNSATSSAGGLVNVSSTPMPIANTIIAGNTVSSGGSDPDIAGTFTTTDHDLIGIVGNATGFTDNNGKAINGNLVGTATRPIDPELGPLQDNGGLTLTRALLPGSPAIDKGDNSPPSSSFPPLPATDQRGYSRIVGDVGVGFRNSGTVDIGAFEVQPTLLVANSFYDNNSNVLAVTSSPASGDLVQAMVNPRPGTRPFSRQFGVTAFTSIQAAINAAGTSGDTIEVEPGTYRESLDITSPVILESIAMAGATTVIDAPSTGSGTGITINTNSASSTVIDGFTVSGFGLGVSVAGGSTATLRDDTLSSNGTSTASGGGINNQGTLNVTQTTITGNQAANGGGAYNAGSLTVTNSTIAGNTAASNGGGIDNAGALSVNNATIAGNSAGSQAGGIFNSGSASVANTIVATNLAQSSDPDVSGSFHSTDHDLIGLVGDANGFTDNTGTAINGNQVGTTTALNPQLGPLADNGGPTQTMALLLGSPAIDAGDNTPANPFAAMPVADQRSFTRVVNGTIDIGAFEVQATYYVANSFYDQTTGQQTSAPNIGDKVNWLASGRFSEVDNLTFGTNAFTSIEGAAAAAPIDAQIDVAAGTYNESVSLTQPVILLGAATGTTSVEAPTSGSGTGISISATQGSVTVEGLTVSGFAIGASVASGSTAVLTDDVLSHNDNNSANVADGTGDRYSEGGGVYNSGMLSVIDCTITDNFAKAVGGGIGNNGSLEIIDSTISGNSAGFGGGVNDDGLQFGSTTAIMGSTISDNSATASGGGAILNNLGALLTVTGSTITGNTARNNAGGIENLFEMAVSDSTISDNSVTSPLGSGGGIFTMQPATITNCTISGNSAPTGGGIVVNTIATLTNCTITGNTAVTKGGGLVANSTGGAPAIKIANTIIAGNHVTGPGATDPDVGGNFTGSFAATDHDLIGIVGDATGFTDNNGNAINGNLVGTAASPIDPKLGPLEDNGGLTQTMALLSGSPAIDKGDNSPSSFPPLPATDQRGYSRIVADVGVGFRNFGTVDIGAFEVQPTLLVANSFFDNNVKVIAVTSSPASGDPVQAMVNPQPGTRLFSRQFGVNAFTSIQAAIDAAGTSGDTIEVEPGTYRESLDITSPVILESVAMAGATTVIEAPNTGSGTGITIDTNSASSTVIDGFTVSGFALGVSVAGGSTATLRDDTLSSNGTSTASGGGINNQGTLNVTQTTITGNQAAKGAGAYNASSLTVTNSTIAGNTAGSNGGGIDNAGALSVNDATIAGNSAGGQAGGIFNSGSANVANTIVATNVAQSSDPDVGGSFAATDHDLIGLVGDATGFTDNTGTAINGNQVGTTTALNPLLGPLANDGGPTQTMALLLGSPAIGAGDKAPAFPFASAPVADQRGFTRVVNGTIDIGAFEVQPTLYVANSFYDQTTGQQTSTPAAGDTVNWLASGRFGEVDNLTFGTNAFTSIEAAASAAAADAQIDVAAGTYTEAVSLTQPVTLLGADAATTSIVAPTVGSGTGITISATQGVVSVEGVTVSGFATGVSVASGSTAVLGNDTLTRNNKNTGFGGGVSNNGVLSVIDCTISGNSAGSGGGIGNNNALLVIDSKVSGNSASGFGGGIASIDFTSTNVQRTATVIDSTISGNTASSEIGGIMNDIGSWLTVSGSTISDNSARFADGGILNDNIMALSDSTITGNTVTSSQGNAGGIFSFQPATLTNCTISGNSAPSGAGIVANIIATLINCTITGNTAVTKDGGLVANGAGAAPAIKVVNTIIAGNHVTGPGATDPDVDGNFTGSLAATDHDLIGIVGDATGFTDNNGNAINGNLVGTATSPLDPKLGPLQDNGGLTQTIALLPGSPAIDKGDNSPSSFPPLPATDQRGFARVVNGTIDIGAYESNNFYVAKSFYDQTMQATTSTPNVGDVVNWPASGTFAEVDGLTFGTNAFSSIQTAANAVPADATIFIAAGTYNETVDVTQPLQLVGAGTAATVIQAPTTGSGIGISAQATTGKVIVDDLTVTGFATGVSVTSGTAVLNNDTITDNGSTSSSAGGVLNFANLTITATTVSGNSAVHGGGIENTGTLSVIASSITGNSARGGAGVENTGTLVVSDSTIANNSATLGAGGGLLSSAGTETISSSTISGNTAAGSQAGGGIAATGGTVNLANTIIAGNSASGSGATDPDVAGAFGLTDHDLIGILGDATGFTTTGAAASVVAGSGATGLGPLESNGGPTQTMALLAGSPAINAGDNAPEPQFALPATDQRGFERIYNNTIDIGAFEVAPLTFAALAAGSYTVTLAPATPPNESQVEIKDANGNVLAQSPVDATSSVAITNASSSVIDLAIDYSNGDPLPSGGLKFVGAGSDSLAVSGYNTTTLTNTYTGAHSGSVQVGTGGTITYSGLLPLSESGTTASIVFNLPGGTVGATLQDDGTTGNNISELTSTTGSFETTTFTEPTGSLTVNAGSGGDTINVATGFTTDFNANLNLNGGTGNDTFNLQASPAGGTTTIDGKGGSNVVNLGSTAPTLGGTLSAIAGQVVVQDTGGSTALTVDDSGDTLAKTILLTATQVSGFNGNASVSYSGVPQLAIDGGSGGNTVNIQSTNAATAYNINTGSGNDSVNVSTDAATDQGNMANIHGNINLVPGAGNDTLNVSDLGGSAGTTYTLSGGNGGPTTLTVSTAGGTISYNAAQSGDFEHFNLIGSAAGGNTYNIPFTSATVSNTITDGSPSGTGGSTFNVQADRLGAGAANNFDGNESGNTFNVNFAADQPIGTAAGTTLTIGGGTTGSSSSRNVVNLNATADTEPRTLGFNYPAASGGTLDVTGLGTGAAGPGIQISAAQEVNFFGGSADNDTETVTASGNQSVLSVTPTSLSTADVLLNGAPEIDNPVSAANNPGVKGGGTAPDLFLAGIGNSGKGGLFVNGSGGQLVVNASTEDSGGLASTSGWGGSGLTFANGNAATFAPLFVTSAVRPAGHAYDNITVNGSSVAIANADPAIGPVATVNIAGGFSNPSPTEPAVTVNAGDEAGTQTNGVADNVNVTLSPTLHFLINGGNPAAASAPNGDQLTVPTSGDVEIWSDNAATQHVSIASSGDEPVTYTSIERLSLSPGNGVVNVYGDNNQPTTSQNDGYQVVGTAPNVFTLAISGNRANAAGYSLPINFSGVRTLNVYGEAKGTTNAHSDVNELDVTPYADNTPQGWGVQTFWNQGNASGGGSLVYNGVAGVSENISLAPSAAEAGQLFSNNAATGTPVAVINYAQNTNLVVNGSSNAGGNTDTLTLKGTNPGNPGTTGNEQFTVDFAMPGTLAGANIIASDAANGSTLLNLQKLTNIGALNLTGGGAAAQNTLTLGGYNPTTGQSGTLDPSLTVAEYPTSSTAGVVSVVQNNGSAANQYPEINYSGIGTLTVNTAPTSPVQGPTVSFGSPNVANSGLQGSSDSGVAGQPATLDDRITSDSTPTFYGTAEANSVVRLYVDMNGDGKVEANDVLIGQAVATPAGGNSQNSIGQWSITSTVDLNNPKFGFSHDGLRTILATSQDVLGNVSSPQSLTILLDTQGPQIGNVGVTGKPNYNLFLNEEPTPTPLANSLDVTFADPVTRSGGFVFPAVDQALATTAANYQLVGRTNGVIPITSVTFTDSTTSGGTGISVATLHFATPLPDDFYTLTVSDAILDNAGNALSGAFNGSFPSGNGSPGSSFTGSFVVNSHPHLAVASSGSVALDINGDGTFNPSNTVPNSDLVETFGYPNDRLLSGKFASPTGTVSGFDEVGAYGNVNGQWRWLLNLDPSQGTSSPTTYNETLSFKGQPLPVAGYFAGNPALGMQVGLFDNGTWYLDVLNHHTIDVADVAASGQLKGNMKGTPIVGDFDGDGKTDLATYQNGVFEFDLSSKDPGGKLTGNFNATMNVAGLIASLNGPGATATPVAADVDGDGITDLGLFVPGSPAATSGQWYWLVSNDSKDAGGANPAGAFASLNHAFNPAPLGHDLSYQYGDSSGTPLVGIWDPPTSAAAASNATPASGWIPALYENVLGRQASQADVTSLNNALAGGQTTDPQVAQTFLDSSERLGSIINGYYEQYLGRAADQAGLNYWMGIWRAGGGSEQVQAGIIGSPEFYATAGKLYSNLSPAAAWVTALYNNILGRAPDDAGLSYWVNYIQTHSLASVVMGFVTSDEYRLSLIDGWFEQYLGRSADAADEQYWLSQMQDGITQDQIQAAILTSDEFISHSQAGA